MRSRTSGWLRTWMGSRDPLPRAPHGNVTPCVTGLDDSRDPNSEGSCVAAIIKPGDTRSKDRKSTRLNSSHGYISYAVFCLKKKKKQLTSQHAIEAPYAQLEMLTPALFDEHDSNNAVR